MTWRWFGNMPKAVPSRHSPLSYRGMSTLSIQLLCDKSETRIWLRKLLKRFSFSWHEKQNHLVKKQSFPAGFARPHDTVRHMR